MNVLLDRVSIVRALVANGFPLINVQERHDPEDWGDTESIGLQLKTKEEEDMQFGMFCGNYNNRFVVARYKEPFWDIEHLELFDTKDEMKARWRLD